MSEPGALLATARSAVGRRRWADAHAAYTAVGDLSLLSADDLAAFADCAWWLCRVDESVALGTRAFGAFLRAGRPRSAATAALGVAVNQLMRGEDVAGSGWLGRAAELLADEPECVEQGYLTYLLEVECAFGDPDREAVLAAARRVRELGRRLGDATLVASGLLGEGRVLVRQGHVREGMARFDEAMVSVVSGEVLPEWAGNIYCHLMSASYELADLRRAWSWVRATSRWLETLPLAATYPGMCRVHRAQVLQVAGDWERSEAEAARACTELEGVAVLPAAEGHYLLGELARMRGRRAAAEESYRRAHHLGRDPQPGLALLRLGQGRAGTAAASIRSALLAETVDPLSLDPPSILVESASA
ncbi:hypothetical protein [Geodermatophilus marinus]|uniref:hypothetical protein n=1 Tax=Geodermatophilus sp. LHW52908 TaxID=2303986 RepID=UPI000E3CC840|nr:hypothetical protein [Geodermatophilus sp. LHW52908]RFU19461.1 hypothetical protein D0Z06_21590 [Geodermatophilus sp. LHW52908]